ncbi:uncharacterized protein LOC106478568 [Limulus polyphemus]|uniref:protein-tyrosine-phosphatase n=1 Tax=Limulus polyphemus TaxID=6850 RepID=A0ABM1C5I9_LIMPO|nr:uncharacterized protein LOC106478568 [Limulus polyphemus]XP_022237883.1 uncharacterized protein LOC106478568 [Limulus polyphemus]
MAPKSLPVTIVDVHQLAAVVRNQIDTVLIIDSRSFLEYNTCHVASAVNVCCSKLVKRRLQQDKISVKELLLHTCQFDIDETYDVVVYDQRSFSVDINTTDTFIAVLMTKLAQVFRSVNLVRGGFLEFQAAYPNLCEDKTWKCTPLTSLSQPCLSVTHQGPTKILPFMYLGSQSDAFNKEMLKNHNITYELNVSANCPKPDFIQDTHFMRISVNDNYSEKLLPFFPKAFQFLDKVREGSGCVLVHCLAGISRSPTIAIAYVMHYLRLSSDEAYRYVKSKRVTISPNFNFLGQLLEFEKQLLKDSLLESKLEVMSAPPDGNDKRSFCRREKQHSLRLSLPKPGSESLSGENSSNEDQSPTTALSKLSFENHERDPEETGKRKQSGRAVEDSSKRRKPGIHTDHSFSCMENQLIDTHVKSEESNTDDSKLSDLLMDTTYISGYQFSTNVYTSTLTTKTGIDTEEKLGKRCQPVPTIDFGFSSSGILNLPCPRRKSFTSFATILEAIPNKSSLVYCQKPFKKEANTPLEVKHYDFKDHRMSDYSKQTISAPFLSVRDAKSDEHNTKGFKYSEAAPLSSKSQKLAFLPLYQSGYERKFTNVLRTVQVTKESSSINTDYKKFSKLIVSPKENPNIQLISEDAPSPSERHLMEEFMDIEDLPNNDEVFLPKRSNAVRTTLVFPERHDSGVPASPSIIEAPLQLSHDGIPYRKPEKSLDKFITSKGESCEENFTEEKYRRHQSLQKTVLEMLSESHKLLANDNWFLLRESKKKNENTEGLYRAQSCPVIAEWFNPSPSPDYFNSANKMKCTKFDGGGPHMRKMKLSQIERKERLQNRFSCGSLECEQTDWKYNNFSCPDMSDFAIGQRSQRSSPASLFSPSHEVFSRHISMIQVS